jgi:hypothetical protein
MRPADTASPAGSAEALIAEALIAEARARARRRRLRIAVAVIGAVAVAAVAVLLTARSGAQPAKTELLRHAAPVTVTGVVTGHLEACSGLGPLGHDRPVTPGTVIVLRGTVRSAPLGHGTWRLVLPAGPAVAQEYIGDNYTQVFRFALPPGRYVLVGRYGPAGRPARPIYEAPGGLYTSNATTMNQVTIVAGRVVREDLPNDCM